MPSIVQEARDADGWRADDIFLLSIISYTSPSPKIDIFGICLKCHPIKITLVVAIFLLRLYVNTIVSLRDTILFNKHE